MPAITWYPRSALYTGDSRLRMQSSQLSPRVGPFSGRMVTSVWPPLACLNSLRNSGSGFTTATVLRRLRRIGTPLVAHRTHGGLPFQYFERGPVAVDGDRSGSGVGHAGDHVDAVVARIFDHGHVGVRDLAVLLHVDAAHGHRARREIEADHGGHGPQPVI